MKRLVLIFLALVATAPPVAGSSLLAVQIGPKYGPEWMPGDDRADAHVSPGSGEQFLDLTLRDIGEEVDDRMEGYNLVVRRPEAGLTLLRAERPADWVFTDPGATFAVEGVADQLIITALSPAERIDLTRTPVNVARLYYAVDPDAAPGRHDINLEWGVTRIISGDPTPVPATPVSAEDPGIVIVTPEPSAVAMLAAAALLALGRRRRARGGGRVA